MIGGEAGDRRDLHMGIVDIMGLGNDGILSSPLAIGGTGGDWYVLEISLANLPSNAIPLIEFIDEDGDTTAAVDLNRSGGTRFYANTAYDASLFDIGNYGYDRDTNTAWAVLDYSDGMFGVFGGDVPDTEPGDEENDTDDIPLPGSLPLLITGLLAATRLPRKSAKK